MAYSSFNNTIFLNGGANTACNKLLEALIQEFTESETLAKFALSGCAADHFQHATDELTIRTISFVTLSDDFYAYLASNASSIVNVVSAIAYADRIQIKTPDNIYIEIWKVASLATTTYNGVVMQTRATIPAALKNYCVPGTFTGDEAALQFSDNPVFNPGQSNLYQQGWVFGSFKVQKSWTQGAAVLQSHNVLTLIRNYANDSSYSGYSAFEVEVISNRGQGNGLLNDFFEAKLDGGTTYVLANNPLKLATVITFINFATLDAGFYSSTITYEVTALRTGTGLRSVVETVNLPIELTVIGSSDVYSEPKLLGFVHTIGEALPDPQTLYVNVSGSYTLSMEKIFSVTGAGITDESTKNFYIKRANGPRTYTIYLTNGIEQKGEGFHNVAITIKHSGGTLVVPVSISQAATNEIRVQPDQLEFEAIIGVEEPEAQSLEVVSKLAYTYEVPQWLLIEGSIGQSFTGTVKPLASSNFAPGTYEGDIVLSNAEGTKMIPVTYVVKANSFTELLPNKVNFALDQHFINFATKIVGIFLRVTYTVTVFDFNGNESTKEYGLHVPVFNGVGKFHPGKLMNVFMSSIAAIDQFIPVDLAAIVNQPFSYYKPSILNVKMEQVAYSNEVVVQTTEMNNLLFVKGTKPKNYSDDCALMHSQYPLRVTKNSYGIINFLKRSGVHPIEIHVNGKKEETINHDSVQDSLFGMVLSFMKYKEGDLVYVKIEDELGGFFERRFYVFPENLNSYHIAWVTQNEQMELMEFTGAYGIESKYERIENNVYQNLVNITEVLKTNRSQPLKTNTGWVLKDNHVLLDSLMMSKKAWLFLPNTDYKIALVPQGKALSNFDSERALYAYDVEFLINPENDAEVYPR